MQYMMAPLDSHYDYGFGATAEAFHHAAEKLSDDDNAIFLGRLPKAFLLRHALELFLKSSIVIIHRKLKLPSGKKSSNEFPSIPVDKRHKALNNVHNVAPLYAYWKEIFTKNAAALQEKAKYPLDFTIDPKMDEAIALVESHDPNSTRYRYPANLNPDEDKQKSSFKEVTADELFPSVTPEGSDPKKTLALVLQDEDGNFVRAYKYDDNTEKGVLDALIFLSGMFYDIHAMMRIAVTDGL
jgi:hypothetical protein